MNPEKITREIICAFNIFEKIKSRYPNRKVIPASEAPLNHFYYFNVSKNRVRLVNTVNWTIWECDWDSDIPYAMRRLRWKKN